MVKRLLIALFVFSIVLVPTLPADAKTVYGNISWYNGVGKIGSDGKILGDWDCATKIGGDNPLPGTVLKAHVYSQQQGITCYKWDTGTLPNAVLDVMPKAFQALGRPLSDGLASGFYYY